MAHIRSLHITTCTPKLRQMADHACIKKSQQKSQYLIYASVTPLILAPS